jgi:hypothetical protein
MHDVHGATWHRLFRPTSARGVNPALGCKESMEVAVSYADMQVGKRLIEPQGSIYGRISY